MIKIFQNQIWSIELGARVTMKAYFDVYFCLFIWVVAESPLPVNVMLAIQHSAFVKGDHTNFEIEPSFGVEASELYPDVKYTTVDEYLDQFVWESKNFFSE